jgi:hypothetical protein
MFSNFTIDIDTTTQNVIGLSDFIKKNHYLKSVARGCKYVFILRENGDIVGAAQFGVPVGTKVKSIYSPNKAIVELKRFVLKDTPKNTASWFMAKCIKYLKKQTDIANIISYADPKQGHEGTIYKASNYTYLGQQKFKGAVYKIGRKTIHFRAAYQKGTKTNKLFKLAKKNGNLRRVVTPPKHIFLYKVS